uniref:Neurobeachin n=1 Tax=Angiostrongylus cantonensis TaxID=6313 RepID=A0A0K0D5U4_ANGCA
MKRCSSLVMLPSLQRILLLSFLSRLTLGHLECYSASVLQTIYSLLVSLIELLEVTPDIRERRFCLEILVAMSPVAAHEEVLTLLNELHLDHISRVDYDFLKSTMKV